MTRGSNRKRALAGVFLAVLFLAPQGAFANLDAKYVWNFATIIPKGMGWGQQYEKLIQPTMSEITDNELWLKIYWGGIQGSNAEVLAKLESGELQGAGFDAGGTVLALKEFAVLELPFLFNDYEEVDLIREKTAPVFDSLLRERGLTLALWLDQDFDQLYTTKTPLKTVDDFQKPLFGNWAGLMEKRVLESLGGKTVPTTFDQAAPEIKKGTFDAALGPAIWVVGTQVYSDFRYIHPVNIRYAPAAVLVTESAWKMLPAEVHTRYEERRAGMQETMNKAIRRDNRKCLAAMGRYGCRVVKPDENMLAQMRDRTFPVWGEMAGVLYPESLLKEVTAHLEEFRAARTSQAAKP